MFDTDAWVIIDTETTGLRRPVYPVEIAAQRMMGWRADGAPFRALVNFDVPIDPMAQHVHGYSREFLRSNGLDPKDAIGSFLDYVKGAPVVAYNLRYDYDTVLCPTLGRMGFRSKLPMGFCAMMLTRNVVAPLRDFKLKTVIKALGIAQRQNHDALGDVDLVVSLLSDVIGPYLAKNGVQGFPRVALCSEGKLAVPPLAPSRARSLPMAN